MKDRKVKWQAVNVACVCVKLVMEKLGSSVQRGQVNNPVYLSQKESWNVTGKQGLSRPLAQNITVWSCFPMHTQGPAQVDTFSFQLLTFRWDPKDLEVLKANGSDCSRGFGQERHHNDILGLTASDVGHPAVPKSPTWAKVESLTYWCPCCNIDVHCDVWKARLTFHCGDYVQDWPSSYTSSLRYCLWAVLHLNQLRSVSWITCSTNFIFMYCKYIKGDPRERRFSCYRS